MVTTVGLEKILNDSLWLADPQKPQFGAKFWDLSLNVSWVIVIFV